MSAIGLKDLNLNKRDTFNIRLSDVTNIAFTSQSEPPSTLGFAFPGGATSH